MTKYQEFYQKMIDENSEIFNKFMDLHDSYQKNPDANQNEYNTIGEKIVKIIRDWERRLCRESERGQYGKFSAGLADKFWSLVRADFPKIDFVGVTVS